MGCFQDLGVGTKGDIFSLSTSTVQEGRLFILKSRIIGVESKGNSSPIWSVGWPWVPLTGDGVHFTSSNVFMCVLVKSWETLSKPNVILNEKPGPIFYWLHAEGTQR